LKVLIRKPKGKELLGRARNGWEDNIKMDIEETDQSVVKFPGSTKFLKFTG
jgi:hypothetical protein